MEWLRQNEVSIPVEIGDQEFLFDPHYDTVHIFSWLGHSIIKLIVEGEGLAQRLVDYEVALGRQVGDPFVRRRCPDAAGRVFFDGADIALVLPVLRRLPAAAIVDAKHGVGVALVTHPAWRAGEAQAKRAG